MAKTNESTESKQQPKDGNTVAQKLVCTSHGCKQKPSRFEFCQEHFQQFKFGLINKKGQPVSDYEKKFEHYQKWQRAQKVA